MAKGQPIVRLTAETNDYERKIKQANKTFDGFLKGIGMSPGKLGAMTVAIGATTTALKVAKDAFFKNEQNLDEWGRTVEASKSLYQGFLHSLNTGDISGFLNNIDRITKAAREAYDALDELATFNAFNKVNLAKARAGFQETVADYREGNGSKESVQQSSSKLISELETKRKLQQNAYEKAVAKIAAERNVPADALMKVMTGSYGTFSELKNLKFTGRATRFYGGGMFGGGGSYVEEVPRGDRERLAQTVKHLNDDEIDTLQSIAESAQMTELEIQNQRKAAARIINGRGGSGGGGGGRGGHGGGGGGGGSVVQKTETQLNNEQIDMLAKQYETASEEHRKEIREQITVLQKRNEEIQRYYDIAIGAEKIYTKQDVDLKGAGVADFAKVDFAKMVTQPADKIVSPYEALQMQLADLEEAQKKSWSPEVFAAYETAIDEMKKKIAAFTGVNLPKAGKDAANAWRDAASAIGQVGSALSSISNPAARIAGIIGEAIAKIALAFADASLQEGKKGIWAWVAASAVGLTTMISTISAIKSATAGNYAEGGIIPGNSYSGDNMRVYGLNAGEIVLNRAQAGNLASQLSGAGANMRLEAVVSGEQLRLVMNGNSRRTGRGEILTTKFR